MSLFYFCDATLSNLEIKLKYLLPILLLLSSCSFIFSKDDLSTVKSNFESGKAILIDARSLGEWNRGHINGARRYQVSDLKKLDEEGKLDKEFPRDKIIYTHCAVGLRAKIAAEVLKERGYDVRPLKEGYSDLIKAGFQSAK